MSLCMRLSQGAIRSNGTKALLLSAQTLLQLSMWKLNPGSSLDGKIPVIISMRTHRSRTQPSIVSCNTYGIMLGSNHGHLKSVNIQNLSHLKCTKGSNNIGGFVPIDFCLIEYQIYVCNNNMVGPKQTEAKHRKNRATCSECQPLPMPAMSLWIWCYKLFLLLLSLFLLLLLFVINNYSQKWKWLEVDLYLTTLQISKSPIMTLSSVADEFLLYTTQIPKISIVLFNILKNSWKLNPICNLVSFSAWR